MSETHKLDLNHSQGSGTPIPGHGKKGRLNALAVGENIKEKQVSLLVLYRVHVSSYQYLYNFYIGVYVRLPEVLLMRSRCIHVQVSFLTYIS